MSKPVTPINPADMIVGAARALGKVDLHCSPRGVTLITMSEIEAMALLLAAMGLHPLPPGAPAPADARTLLTPIQGPL